MAHPPRRRLAPEDAELLYDQYVSALRQGVMQPADRAEDWQTLAGGMWEHVKWLNEAMLRELLGKTLSDEFVIGSLNREETLATKDGSAGCSSGARPATVV
jgi:hypothetical protein